MSFDVSFYDLRFTIIWRRLLRGCCLALADLRLYIFMLPFVMPTYIHLLSLSLIVLALDRLCLLSFLAVADTIVRLSCIKAVNNSIGWLIHRLIHKVQSSVCLAIFCQLIYEINTQLPGVMSWAHSDLRLSIRKRLIYRLPRFCHMRSDLSNSFWLGKG